MANEIKVLDNVAIKLVPGTLELSDKEKLLKMADSINEKYSNQIVTDETIKGDKKIKQQISKIVRTLETERKEKHKAYEQPYEQFKNDINEVVTALEKTVKPLSEQIKTVEDQQRQEILAKVKALINQMAPNYNIDPNSVEIEQSWTNATMTESKLTKILGEGFKARKEHEEREQQIHDMSVQLIQQKCEALNISSSPWLFILSTGTDVSDITKAIDESVAKKQAEITAKAKKQEARIALRELVNKHVGDKLVDENGEILNDEPIMVTSQIEVTATRDELADLYDYMNLKELDYSTHDVETIGGK